MRKILIVDEDSSVRDSIARQLDLKHFTVVHARDALTGIGRARDESPDLIVLDPNVPGMAGFDVCKMLNADRLTRSIPIIILSERCDEIDRVLGFELGAFDYITKPFSPREAALRISVILGCNHKAPPSDTTLDEEVTIGGILLNASRHRVAVNGKLVKLTAVEFKLLCYLMKTRGRIQARDRLLNEVWEYENALITRTVDTHVLRLRKKLGKAAESIETVHGFGYRFREAQEIKVSKALRVGPALERASSGKLIAGLRKLSGRHGRGKLRVR